MIYILKFHSESTTPKAYKNLKNVIQTLRYCRTRNTTLYMVDTKTLELKEISLPSIDR